MHVGDIETRTFGIEHLDDAADLSRQLLAIGRRQVLKLEVLDLDAVLRDMEGMLARVIGEDVELRVVCGDEPLPVRIDRGQMEQVVLNLATNARDAMPGGGRLELRTARAGIDEWQARTQELPAPGAYVTLDVRLAKEVAEGFELAVVGQNLWQPHHQEFAPGTQVPRGLYGQFRWQW